MPLEHDECLGTQAEIEAKVEGLRSEGWQVLPCDDPMRALRGYCAFRYLSGDPRRPVTLVGDGVFAFEDGSKMQGFGFTVREGNESLPIFEVVEEARILQWPMFDRPLEPVISDIDPAELATAIRENPHAVQCDDPRQRLIGFAWHRPQEGKSIVRRTRLTQIKQDSENGQQIIEFRSRFKSN